MAHRGPLPAVGVSYEHAAGEAAEGSDTEAEPSSEENSDSNQLSTDKGFDLFGDPDSETSEEETPEDLLKQPVVTLRIFAVSSIFTFGWSFINQMGIYRTVNFSVDTTVAILLTFPLMRLLAAYVPSCQVRLLGVTLDTNPGPFTLREHLLLSCSMSDASSTAYVANTLWVMENDFGKNLGFMGDFLMIVFTKILGYGLGVIFYRCLIMSSTMPWPNAVYMVEVYKMLHGSTIGRLRVFFACFVMAFFYIWLPDLFWPGLSSLAVLCWFSNSRTTGVLGSGLSGFGIGTIDLNLSHVFGYFPFLLYIPAWLGLNAVVGGIFWAWILSPLLYFNDYQHARNMDPMGFGLYTEDGCSYPILEFFDRDGVWNQAVYDRYGSPYMSAWFSWGYWFSFIALTSSITHTICWHWGDCRAAFAREGLATLAPAAKRQDEMYEPLQMWTGFAFLAVLSCGLVVTNMSFGVDMPWWSVLVSVLIAAFFVVPIGAIQAVTGNQIGLNILAEMIGGLMLKHNPVGAILVKVTGYMSMSHGLSLVQNLKMGQLLAVDYKAVFVFQVWGTVMTSLADAVAYRMVMDAGLTSGDNPEWNSSSSLRTYKTASYLWGGIGPWDAWMGPRSHYSFVFWSGMAVGVILPPLFWFLYKKVGWKFVGYIHIPMFTLITSYPATNAWYLLTLGLILLFQVVLPWRSPAWAAKYNYVLVAGLVGGAGITSFVVAMLSGFAGVSLSLPDWMQPDAGCNTWQAAS